MEDSKDRVNDEKSSSLEGSPLEEEALNVNGSAETCAEANVSDCKELTDEDILGEDYVMDGIDRDSVVQLVIDHLLDEIELQQDDQSEEEMKTRMLKMTQRTWHFEQAKVARIPRDVFDHFAVFEEDSNTVKLNVTQLKVFIDKYLWNASNYVEAAGWRTNDMKIHSNLSVPEKAPENRDILVKSYETKNADQENKQILELAEVRDKRRADDATRFNERLQQHLSGGGTLQSLMRIITTEKHATDHEQKFAKSRGFFKPPRAENNNSRPRRRADHGHRDGDQSAAHKRPFAAGRGGRGGDNRGFRGGGRHRETAGPPQKRPRNDSGGDRRMSNGRDRGGSERRGRGGGGDGRDRRNSARSDRNERNGPRGGGFGGGRSDRGGGVGRGGYRGSNSRDGGGRGLRGGRGRGGGGGNASGQRPNRGPSSAGGFGNRADFGAPSAVDYSGYGEPQYGGSECYGTSSAYDHSNYYQMGYDGSAYVDPSYGQYYQ